MCTKGSFAEGAFSRARPDIQEDQCGVPFRLAYGRARPLHDFECMLSCYGLDSRDVVEPSLPGVDFFVRSPSFTWRGTRTWFDTL